MKSSKPMLDQVSKLSSQRRPIYLACLAHGLTVAARDGYEVGGSGLTNPAMVRRLNEIQHEVTGALADFLATGTSTWTAEALTEMLLACEDETEKGRLEFIAEIALDRTERSRM